MPWESPGFVSDPYPTYDRLRTADPVHFEANAWVLSRYADIAAVLKDGRFGFREVQAHPNPPAPSGAGNPAGGQLLEILRKGQQVHNPWLSWLGSSNPPHHTRLRAALATTFSPASVAGQRPRIEALTEALLDRVQAAGEMDLIADLADPLPIRVIGEILGVPAQDLARLTAWSRAMKPRLFTPPTLAEYSWGLVARGAFVDYLRPLLDLRRREPLNDLMSLLLQTQAEGKQTAEEVVANCMAFFIAGQETTSALLGTALLALLRHPEQMQRLREEPALIISAVEEFLRYDTPAPFIERAALADVELDGRSFRANQGIMLLFGAANRDPAAFTEPDRLAVDRAPNAHLGFSMGMHYCLGAHLARLEAQIVLGAVIRRLPRLALRGAPWEWRSN
jgi:hypothetical protein